MTHPRVLRKSGTLAVVACGLTLAGCDAGEGETLGEVRTLATARASNPTVSASPDGSFLVSWVAMGAEGGDIQIVRLGPDGSPEGEPVRVNHVAGDADPHEQAPAQVAVGPDGEVLVLWQKVVDAPWLDFGGADLRLARSTDGGRTFEPAITVNDNPTGSPARISFHNLAVAEDGAVYASWIDARVRDHAREVAYIEHWHETHAGHGAGADPAAGAPAGTAPGMGMAGMTGMAGMPEEPGTEMRIASSRDGGRTFGPSLIIDGNTCPCCRTTLALGAPGEVYVAWRKIFDGGIRDIAVARSTDGAASFGEPHAVHSDGWEFPGCPHAGPSLAVDEEGRLHAAWYTGRDDRQGLWYAVSSDGGVTFSEPTPVLTDEWVPPSQARLAVHEGEVWVAWDDLREPVRRVRLARIEGGRVGAIAFEGTGQSPQLTFGRGGGLLVWHDGEAVRSVAIGF